jgi:VWFA-related protein
MGDLRREDRLKLLLFNMRVSRIVDFTNDVRVVERALRDAKAGGSTSLLDAISIALVSQSVPDRRQLVVFFTDGSDSISTTTPETLRSVAQRARATLTFVIPSLVATSTVVPLTTGSASVTTSRAFQLTPPSPLEPLFQTLSRETGGSLLRASINSDLSMAFRRVLDEFRSAYVLYYNARGVDRGGYHELEVKVKRDGATVLARRGYWN